MPNFIRGVPASDSPLRSSEIRNNFLALDERTNKVIIRATIPASKSVITDGGMIYFANRQFIDLSAAKLDLGDNETGVQQFYNIGFFKDIAVVARLVFNSSSMKNEAIITYIEGPEKATNISEPHLVPICATDLPIAFILVRHNGVDLSSRGQIEPIAQSSIVDSRNFLDVGGIEYCSAVVGDRRAQVDAYGAVVLDSYGDPLLEGETVGTFVSSVVITQDPLDPSSRVVNYSNPLQDAIDSLEGKGGKILLRRGTYKILETINIPDNIVLLGEGKSTILERGEGFEDPLVVISGNNVSLEKISFIGKFGEETINNETSVKISSRKFFTLKDCYFQNSLICLDVDNSHHSIISNNYFVDFAKGIKMSDPSSKNLATSNQFVINDGFVGFNMSIEYNSSPSAASDNLVVNNQTVE